MYSEDPYVVLLNVARWLRARLGDSTVDYADLIGEVPATVLAWEDEGEPIPIDREQQLRMMVLTHPQVLEYPVPVRQMPSYSVDNAADSDTPAGLLLEILDSGWGVPRRVA